MQSQILQLVNPAIALIFAAAFAALWFGDRTKRHTAILAAAFVVMAAAYISFHFNPDPDGVVPTVIMHVLTSAALAGLMLGVCERVGARYSLVAAAMITAGFAVLMVLTSGAENHMPRIIAGNTGYGLILALGTQSLARGSSRGAIDRLLVWMFALSAAQFFVQPYLGAIIEGPMTSSEYRETSFFAVVTLNLAVWSMMLAMAIVAACVVDHVANVKTESETDGLTGLTSRRAFERDAVVLIDNARAKKTPVAAIVADIDHFKRVNDMWGHQVGDRAIAAFGALLNDAVRNGDRVGRIGGEEFCILAWDCTGHKAARLAERIRADFARAEIEGLSEGLHLTASFGVAECCDGEGYGRLFARADAALYRAKANGRDRVEGQMPEKTVAAIADARRVA
ncbi:GGDEF domain-containing protein [Qipengyuania spongiae]|uniref:diguanylate cyclase n=1 Tax=Qipengyuania spongiae TaxID=2909673 RepID=A0ABY5SVD6_9SPHN|nr:GGDEF domain-containing protein [Qipengyuania spongiae]UVI38513.1 GGDEF domain-containing protein [Qipengyuania spongiae]